MKCQRQNYRKPSKAELSLRKHLLLLPINRLVVSYTNCVDLRLISEFRSADIRILNIFCKPTRSD